MYQTFRLLNIEYLKYLGCRHLYCVRNFFQGGEDTLICLKFQLLSSDI